MNPKPRLLPVTVILFALSLSASAQDTLLTEEALTGTWKAVNYKGIVGGELPEFYDGPLYCGITIEFVVFRDEKTFTQTVTCPETDPAPFTGKWYLTDDGYRLYETRTQDRRHMPDGNLRVLSFDGKTMVVGDETTNTTLEKQP